MTTSFKKKFPVPTPVFGFAMVITGAVAYPNPALVSRISVIVPAALTIATPVAFAVDNPDGDVDMDTTGGDVYLVPATELNNTFITFVPIPALATAPEPPAPLNVTVGAIV